MLQKEQEVIELFQKLETSNTVITTSAGSTSLVLIDLLYRSNVKIPVVFIDTGFLFQKTIDFFTQNKAKYFNIEFITLISSYNRSEFLENGKILNTEYCCKKNKVDLLRNYLIKNKIEYWISGPRKTQTNLRKNLSLYEKTNFGTTKVYPMLEWTEDEMMHYLKEKELPLNPLYYEGYESIGCYPCTQKGQGRDGRWNGEKTECGLHIRT
ncbi:MAG: phosphoadenylyl-sulfate reductase [Arcobacteraceae bacterium]